MSDPWKITAYYVRWLDQDFLALLVVGYPELMEDLRGGWLASGDVQMCWKFEAELEDRLKKLGLDGTDKFEIRTVSSR